MQAMYSNFFAFPKNNGPYINKEVSFLFVFVFFFTRHQQNLGHVVQKQDR
jgi:hypothetical protein